MTDRQSFFSRILSSASRSRRPPATRTGSPPKPITTGRRQPTTTKPPPTTKPTTTTTATSAPTATQPPPATATSIPNTAPPLPSATTTSDPKTGPTAPATTTAAPTTTTQLSPTSTPTPPPAITTIATTTVEPPPSNPSTPPPLPLPLAVTGTTEPPPSNLTTTQPPTSPSSPTTSPPPTTTSVVTESEKVDQSTAGTTNTTTPHTHENQTPANQPTTTPDSPSNLVTSSPSPTRITTKSSPSPHPQSLSPSHAIPPYTRSKPSSPSRVSPQTPSTPQRVPQPRSPSRTPKRISSDSKIKQHTSPSKGSTQEISTSNKKSPKSHQETKPDSSTTNGTNNPLFGSNEQHEGPTDVKEIFETTNNKANGETMKEGQFGSEEKIMEKGEIPSVKLTSTMNSQPKKRNTNSNIHNRKSTLPIRENAPLQKDIKEDISTFLNRMSIADPTKAAQERPVSVITLVGENRGASMQMGSGSSKTEGSIPIHRSYKINSEENVEARTTTGDGEGSSEGKKRRDAEDQPKEAHVNNNAQGINNSIVFNGSITEGSPGVHMVVNHVPKKTTESTEKPSLIDARKAEFNSTRMEKLTYEPTVRRRCLRGLFLEPSDSDQENPEKPRRHGCRVGCQQSNKGNNIDVL